MFQIHCRRTWRDVWRTPCIGGNMGFFSRFFRIREQDSSSPETTWAVEDNGSELVLDEEYASMLMTEIDIDAAIISHEGWRLQLQVMVHGRSNCTAGGEFVSFPHDKAISVGNTRESLRLQV